MKLEYKINEQDFLAFQLFSASKSERINKQKRHGWIIMTVGSLLVTFYFYLNHYTVMTIYFALIAIASGLFYPKYFRWKHKKNYKTHIQENYSKRFGQIETLEIRNDSIISKDKTGEGKIFLSELEKIDETKNHFFLKISSGLSLIIPKNEIENSDKLRQKFIDLGLTLNNETHWK